MFCNFNKFNNNYGLFSLVMKILLLIGTGGFIGSVLRYATSVFIQGKFAAGAPLGTFGVNIIGCLLIGILFQLSERSLLPDEWRWFLAVGICGGFTTFSTFSTDALLLMKNGQMLSAFLYVAGSVLLGIAATFAGIAIVKVFYTISGVS